MKTASTTPKTMMPLLPLLTSTSSLASYAQMLDLPSSSVVRLSCFRGGKDAPDRKGERPSQSGWSKTLEHSGVDPAHTHARTHPFRERILLSRVSLRSSAEEEMRVESSSAANRMIASLIWSCGKMYRW